MSNHANPSRKRALSDHQKQMRFFTGLAIIVSFLIMGVLFWLVNRPVFNTH